VRTPARRFKGVVTGPDGEPWPIFVSTERHVCSPYCRDGAHAVMLYREEADELTRELVQSVADLVAPDRIVLDVQPVAEAPLPDGFTTAWLVTCSPLPAARSASVAEAER
jgi:hypothetical protein